MKKILDWLNKKRRECRAQASLVRIDKLCDWEYKNGEIKNKKGKNYFFTIKGVEVKGIRNWDQPILCQEKYGVLAIFCQRQKRVMKYLLQARYEPGLINKIQLAPTIQTIERNVKYYKFLKSKKGRIIYQARHSEEGTRFWHKENLNILLELDRDFKFPKDDNFIWLTLREIKKLMRLDDVVNPYVKTVLAAI